MRPRARGHLPEKSYEAINGNRHEDNNDSAGRG